MPKLVIIELPRPPDWTRALCAAHGEPDLWSSTSQADRVAAILVCRLCPLRQACAEWSLSLPTSDRAIYGGLWYADRLRLRRQRQAEREAARLAAVPAGGARRNASKQTCDSGHELSGANLLLLKDPRDGRQYRQCRECRRASVRAYQRRLRLLRREQINARKRAAYAVRRAAA